MFAYAMQARCHGKRLPQLPDPNAEKIAAGKGAVAL
jgi:hypothetical protein